MMRRYTQERRRRGYNPVGMGGILVGSVSYSHDRGFLHDRVGGQGVSRNP